MKKLPIIIRTQQKRGNNTSITVIMRKEAGRGTLRECVSWCVSLVPAVGEGDGDGPAPDAALSGAPKSSRLIAAAFERLNV